MVSFSSMLVPLKPFTLKGGTIMRAMAFMLVLSMVLLSTAALADVPGLINYQGTLTDDAGVAQDTTVTMTFSIYNDSTGGTQVWTEAQAAVEVNSGMFNVLLGSVNTISDTVFKEPTRWLGIQVGGDAEMTPRQRIASVGYAFVSGTVGIPTDGDWTISGDDMYSAVSGNVGIGITTPATKLDVYGVINTDSVFSIGGTTVLSVEGPYNTLVGEGAGANVDDGYCTFVGYQAGYNATGFGDNTFVGYQAGYSDQSMRGTFIGLKAGYANTTGLANTFVGYIAGRDNTTGGSNTFLGSGAGTNNEDGNANTFLGNGAGNANVSGGNNTFVGDGAGFSNEASWNTFVGIDAGRANTSGNENTFLGRMTGWKNTTGSDNTYLGSSAGFQNTEGHSNTFVGMDAGHDNTTGIRNVALGLQAGYNNSTGNYNVFLGYKAGYDETGSEKLYIANGPDTNDVLMYGDFANDMIGIGTLNPTEKLDVSGTVQMIGFKMPTGASAGRVLTSDGDGLATWQVSAADSDWTISGDDVYSAVSGNVGVGTTSPAAKLHVAGNALLDDTLFVSNVSSDSTLKFKMAGATRICVNDSTGCVGIWMGSPGYPLDVNGDINIANKHLSYRIDGFEVLRTPTALFSESGNTFVGKNAGNVPDPDLPPRHGTMVGYGAGSNNEGANNTYIGYAAGAMNTTGHDNVFLGHEAGYHETGSNKLYIANSMDTSDVLIFGDFSAGNVGIGVMNPISTLDVKGNITIRSSFSDTVVIELGEGLDYAEGFDVSENPAIEPGAVLMIDSENPGKLALSTSAYDTRVAGIVAGARDMRSGVRLGAAGFDYDVALAGRVYCNVDATETSIEPGDLLTTSSTPGYAMKAVDSSRATGAILGKAMEPLAKGQKGQILVLVTLQ